MKTICVLGTGYVGLVTGACFSDLGNKVICVDIDEAQNRRAPAQVKFPSTSLAWPRSSPVTCAPGGLNFTTDYQVGLKDAEFIFIAVGHAIRLRRRGGFAVRAHGRRIDRRGHGPPPDHHQQIDGAGGHRRLGGRHHSQTPDRAPSPSGWCPIPSSCAKARPSTTS